MDEDYIPLDNFGEDEMEFWDEKDPEIRLNMFFTSKKQVDYAVRMWNVNQNREIFMAETRPKVLTTKCKSIKETNYDQAETSQPCLWTCTARKLKDSNCFKMTTWTPAHSCFTTVPRNNNRALRSKAVAAHIQEHVHEDLSLPVKQIRSLIKEKLNVDITYGKAWAARKKAFENIYGTWDQNFHELPSYIMALQQANPGTVVQWLHHPNSPSHCSVFKYVFWAFRPSIEAFNFCIPVVSIDATHLRGTYKGKILIAVSKNANNMILPIAYALVDEETNASWGWFLQKFAENVVDPTRRTLCVISDRNAGIKNAMDNLESWKEPHAYHRFCLRHVTSNFMAKCKNVSLKKMCRDIGNTTQERKYERLMAELKATNKQAWQYLRGIDKTKWTLLYDRGNRRWGNLTTNISESMNNVLRGARMLPIKALIEYTFKREVDQYAIHYRTAYDCSTDFPHRMWEIFHDREIRARQHRVYPYSAHHQRFMVETRLQTSDESGHSPYTVEFQKKTCSCGKWQIYRFPCSHAIAVCHHLRESPRKTADARFYTETYRAQYSNQYFPVPHMEDWIYAGWQIHGDPSKISIVRGRRRARRMHNEMDASYAEERTGRRCSGCKRTGHRINACPNRQH